MNIATQNRAWCRYMSIACRIAARIKQAQGREATWEREQAASYAMEAEMWDQKAKEIGQ